MYIAGAATFDATTFANNTGEPCHGVIDVAGDSLVWLVGVRFESNQAPTHVSAGTLAAVVSADAGLEYAEREDETCSDVAVAVQPQQPQEAPSLSDPQLLGLAEVLSNAIPWRTQGSTSTAKRAST